MLERWFATAVAGGLTAIGAGQWLAAGGPLGALIVALVGAIGVAGLALGCGVRRVTREPAGGVAAGARAE
jgi:hypothetical protein